jgi:GNAT superfamily N-acetyltransferase
MTDIDRTVYVLGPEDEDRVADVLADAFYDYPVMRHIVGVTPEYATRLRTLVGFFVAARVLREEPMLGVKGDEDLVAAAIVTLPGERTAPKELHQRRTVVWSLLGAEARARYERLGEVWRTVGVEQPCHHLNMIGVRRSMGSLGRGRALLDAVHALAAADPASSGVSLTTEDPVNVGLYQHCGYRIVGQATISDTMRTWGFFRPND